MDSLKTIRSLYENLYSPEQLVAEIIKQYLANKKESVHIYGKVPMQTTAVLIPQDKFLGFLNQMLAW